MSDSNSFLDPSETRPHDEREQETIVRFKEQVRHAQTKSDYFSDLLKNIDPE